MRLIHILCHYMKGVRLLAFVLSLLMLWAIICGVAAYGKLENIKNDLNIVTSANYENAYLLASFLNMGGLTDQGYTKSIVDALEERPEVHKVLSVRVVNPISYEGNAISIVLYEPETLAFFPALKKSGINFDRYPNGCILGSKLFNWLDTGQMISLSFSGTEVQIPVAGHLTSPYRHFSLSVSSSSPQASDLFVDGDAIIMQATPEVLSQLSKVAKRIEFDSNLIVIFKEHTTFHEQQAVLSDLASAYRYFPLKEVVKNTEQEVAQTLKQELPQPILLAIMSFVSFFSILILTIKKKNKNIAVLYLCGCSRKKCAVLTFMVSQIFLFAPLFLSIVFVTIWPHIDWHFMRASMYTLRSFLESITINISCIWVVIWYYLIASLSAVAITVAAISKHTPISYLRGKL